VKDVTAIGHDIFENTVPYISGENEEILKKKKGLVFMLTYKLITLKSYSTQ
jgi:hypothetical protein